MMSYTREEIEQKAKGAVALEVYRFTDSTGRLHTDFIERIDDLSDVNFDADGHAEGILALMDEEEYNSTILANCGVTFADIYDKGDTVCIFVVKWPN